MRPADSAETDHDSDHGLLGPLVDAIGGAVDDEVHVDAFRRDPEFIMQQLPLVRAINRYFGTEVRGWENLPERGPMLIVGNHSGGALTTDMCPLIAEWVKKRGAEDPLYGLGYSLTFAFPRAGPALRKLGILPASHTNARKALDKGAAVVVFPGGDHEVFRPWAERNRIDFAGRLGFVELALCTGVPVIPMTTHGAHESVFVLTRGRRIARLLGTDRLKVKVFPLIWSVPFGLAPGFFPTLPLPSKVTVQLGKPLDWSQYGAQWAADPDVLQSCYDEITGVMQHTLDELAKERPYPLLSRLNELRPSTLIRHALARRWSRS